MGKLKIWHISAAFFAVCAALNLYGCITESDLADTVKPALMPLLCLTTMAALAQGVGIKVARKGITGGVKNWHSFSQEMKMLGIEVRNYELRVYFKKPTKEIANFFGISEDERCVVMERLRGNTSFPFVFFVSYFNPKLPITGEENFNMPLYEMLESNYGIYVKTSREEVYARLAGESKAAKLEISPNDPILIRKRFVSDDNGVPVEYNIGYYRADSFTYTIESSI